MDCTELSLDGVDHRNSAEFLSFTPANGLAICDAETFNGSQQCAENNKNYIFGKILDMDAKSLDFEPRQCQLPAEALEQGAVQTKDKSARKER